MSCDVGELTKRLENEQSSVHSPSFPSLHYVTAHSPTILPLYIHHSSFSNPSVASATTQVNLQPFFRFSYITGFSFASPGEPPMLCSFYDLSSTSPTSQLILQHFRRFTYVTIHFPILPLLHLPHSSFSNRSFTSPTSQALHLRHPASRPCIQRAIFY